ncbi:exo-alpha-sialidase [Endozoicomonas sp. SM1973]|uniref:Exo-alpha-sialidase n=1 Tax=Spartinivicinus marinus TaxID=2994442 RepID=A0A853I0H9_9GAMM|nr:sialidase family protein [Spartinivicinus marinus]MCX4029875.1 exo-alpha-sialidase [Spartinivicinus marinus]NYZ64882.1 exo-alpha-sialidase [Spartinivicinus marinus]
MLNNISNYSLLKAFFDKYAFVRIIAITLVSIIFIPMFQQALLLDDFPAFSLKKSSSYSNNPLSNPVYTEQFASSGITPEVHSVSVVFTGNNNMHAFWYGGEREGAKDVAIYTAQLDVKRNQWHSEKLLFNRANLSSQLNIYLKKLGNVVSIRDNEGKIWLFFVSVSIGGWAVSSINFVVSDDDARSWSKPRRLITSPMFNLSTLVKGEPFLYENGSIGLPVYHEMIGKFGELLRLSPTGDVLDKARLSYGRSGLQPILLSFDSSTASVYLRNGTDAADSTLLETKTIDSGKSWQKPYVTDLPNPNAAVSGMTIDSGGSLLVINNLHDKRNNLSLFYKAKNSQRWRLVHQFEHKKNTDDNEYEYSYPTIKQSHDGNFHVLYTWNKTHIKHIRFNQAWLKDRIKK